MHCSQREFFNGFGFSSQFPSLSNPLGLFHIHFSEAQNHRVHADMSLNLESQRKPTFWGRYQQDSDLQELPAHCTPALLLNLLSQMLLLAGDASSQWLFHPSAYGAEPPPDNTPSVSMLWPAASPRLPSPSMICSPTQFTHSASPKQGFQLHCWVTWTEDNLTKGPQVSVHHRWPLLLSTAELDSCLEPCRLPAPVLVIACRGFALRWFSDSAQRRLHRSSVLNHRLFLVLSAGALSEEGRSYTNCTGLREHAWVTVVVLDILH